MDHQNIGSGKDGSKTHYSFRNLSLWKKGQELAIRVVKMTERLPRTIAARELTRQLVKSAGSVPANIAEGHARYSLAAYRNHLSIARGSVAEVLTWIDELAGVGYLERQVEAELAKDYERLFAGLMTQMQALEAKLRRGNNGNTQIREPDADYDFRTTQDGEVL